jgi:predicted ATP-grasp superfamily ATP-dependent carboligase
MEYIRWSEPARLHQPTIVAAFTGWNDAGDAASLALRHLIAVTGATKIGTVEADEFYDFQSSRPQVRLVDGTQRTIVWPSVDIYAASTPAGDLLLVLGVEPQLRWQTFCTTFVELARSLNATLAITFGALLADVPHSRPTNVFGSSGDAATVDKFDLMRSRYEGPTGIVGVMNHAFGEANIPTISLWAAVPSYVSNTASPKAALALLARFSTISPRPLMLDGLQKASRDYERDVTAAVAEDDDLVAYVDRLEHLSDHADPHDDDEADDDSETAVDASLPDSPKAAEEFVSEVEKFLRDQNG